MSNILSIACRCLLLAGLLLFAIPGLAQAQAQAKGEDPVIAVLDVQRVLRDSAAAKSIRAVVDERRKAFEAEIEDDRTALKADEEKLRQQQAVLAPEALNQRRRELERRYAELRRRADEVSGAINKGVNAAMRTLRQEMANVLAGIMKEKDINITLARSAVLIFDEDLNVTEEVLSRLDERLPKLEVTIEAPAAN